MTNSAPNLRQLLDGGLPVWTAKEDARWLALMQAYGYAHDARRGEWRQIEPRLTVNLDLSWPPAWVTWAHAG